MYEKALEIFLTPPMSKSWLRPWLILNTVQHAHPFSYQIMVT
jgi:hypothetical protein